MAFSQQGGAAECRSIRQRYLSAIVRYVGQAGARR
jgi:hypothetical protein